MPTRITTKDQNTYEAEYTYDGQGRKLRATYQKKVMDIIAPARPLMKTMAMSSRFEGLGNSKVRPETIIQDTIIHGAPIGDYSEFSQTDYCGNIIYRGNRATVLNAHGYTNIDTDAATGESTATHYYYLKDHLGNNRVVFRDDGLVVQENHYYAYGNLTADCYGSDTQQYKYNGKELDRKLGIDLYDYGARWYDAVLGRFTTMDPLCEEDYDVSPYVYCINNPIKYIDPTGMDYWSTSDSYEINRFFQSWQSGSNIDYSGWNHTSDADFLANLSYNDKTGNFLYSYGAEENGELVCYGKVFPSLRDTKTSLNIANDVVNNFGSSLNKNAGNSTVGSNGHFYWHSGMERGFYGNQYVSTMSLAKFGRGISKITGPIGKIIDVVELQNGFNEDGGKFSTMGYHTTYAAVDVVGGWAGSWLGFQAGSLLGTSFGGVPGAIVGGVVFGIAGGLGVSLWSTDFVDYMYGRDVK